VTGLTIGAIHVLKLLKKHQTGEDQHWAARSASSQDIQAGRSATFEDQFSADVASRNHPMCADRLPRWSLL